MTGKKSKNMGQRNRYYVTDSHPAIVSAEIFDKVQEEMAKRSRIVTKMVNTFWGICLYAAIAVRLIGEERKETR